MSHGEKFGSYSVFPAGAGVILQAGRAFWEFFGVSRRRGGDPHHK